MLQPDRKRNRLLGFDYSRDALYFVTSCVKDRAHVFGTVTAGEMQLNRFGNLAEQQWHWLAAQYPYVRLHAFVVMPNHVHGILEINRDWGNNADPVRTGCDLSLSSDLPKSQKIKSLSELMGANKTTSSKLIRQAGLTDFAWHRSFHDHIIRSERAYQNIKNYIETNPQRWEEDSLR